MTEQRPQGSGGRKPEISFARIAIWVVVGAVGAYLLISGIVGIIAKG